MKKFQKELIYKILITLIFLKQLKCIKMKNIFQPLTVALTTVVLLTACKKETNEATPNKDKNEIPQEVLIQIKAQGFGTGSVQQVDEGYLVEGDILLTKEHLESKPLKEFLRIGNEEQYRTSNTVLGLPRTIKVRVSTGLLNYAAYVTATDSVIARYNALNLLLKFSRVTSGGTIVLKPDPEKGTYYAYAGFPTDAGNPYNEVIINDAVLGRCSHGTKTSVIAHELGHCIGLRHTDYKDRSFSCGGARVNEGAGSEGAKSIPGTPVGPEPNSWMLSCIACGADRPFNANDKIALNWLY